MSTNNISSLFYEVKTESNSTAILNKKQIVSVVNSSKTWSHIAMTNGEAIVANCDFDDLSLHLAALKHGNSD